MNGSLLIVFCFVAVSWAQNQDSACPPNEILHKCVNSRCQNQKCNEIGIPVACPQVFKCIPGCICADEYLRAANGTCVPVKDCEPLPCPQDKNMYTQWKNACPKDLCKDPDNKCNEPSKIGCICQEGSRTLYNSRTCDDFICHCPQIADEIWCINSFKYHMV